MTALRYDAAKNTGDEFWSVIDIFTGEAAWYEGIELNELTFDQVDDMVGCLNFLSAQRMGTLKQP